MTKDHKLIDPVSLFLIVCLIAFDIAAWWSMVAGLRHEPAKLYFLGVSKGSSELLVLPNEAKLLIDTGADQSILKSLANVLSQDDASIDLAIISAPVVARFGGMSDVLDHYHIGAILYDGRSAASEDSDAWNALLTKVRSLRVPLITIGAGSVIRTGDGAMTILSPDGSFAHSASLADAALVEEIQTGSMSALLASDAGANVEKLIVTRYGNIHVDILQGDASFQAFTPIMATSSRPGVTMEIWIDQRGSAPRAVRVRTIR